MPTPEPILLPLAQAAPALLNLVGGKAANLVELVRAGFPVPDGFCITTAAYTQVAALAQIEPLVAGLHEAPAQNSEALAAYSRRIRLRLQTAPFPTELAAIILAAYHELGSNVPVAVRSSATAEDLPEAAFAGQQDTFLNVIGAEAVLDAVRRCWASLWTDRAIAYRLRQVVDQRTVALAVVIQHLVAAESAGVLFTANPITGARNEIVIDSSPGLGEAVVSGMVTPDHFVLRRGRWGWRVTERRPGRREVVIQARLGGGTENIEPPARSGLAPLPGRALRRLAHLGAAIQHHFDRPQDVEWAWANGQVSILQARPMTALPEPLPQLSRPVQMLSAMFAEMFPIRPYPLDQTSWVPAISAGAVEPLFKLLGLSVPSIATFFVVEDGVVVRFSGRITARPTLALLVAPARILWMAIRYDPRRFREDHQVAQAQTRIRVLQAQDSRTRSWEAAFVTVHEALALPLELAGAPRQHYLPGAAIAVGLLRMVLGLLRQGHRFGALFSDVESRTLETNRALETLADRVRSEPELADLFAERATGELRTVLMTLPAGAAFLIKLQSFLDDYGHREVAFSTMLEPTWKDAPDLVLGLIQGLAQSPPRPRPSRPGCQAAQAEVLAQPLLRFAPLRSAMLALIATARTVWQIREDTHFEATRSLPILRSTLLELGRRLVVATVLERPEAVFHLTLDELEQTGDVWPPSPSKADELRAKVLRRQARRVALEGTPLIDPRLYRQPAASTDMLLTGTPGSPGVAEGPVRVINKAEDFGKLRAGEVLVAPYTNPAWTPLFQRAVAIIVDGGAAGSHAAIVAREYGIPAVMGTVTGTQMLADGERVRVDGDHGQVTRLA